MVSSKFFFVASLLFAVILLAHSDEKPQETAQNTEAGVGDAKYGGGGGWGGGGGGWGGGGGGGGGFRCRQYGCCSCARGQAEAEAAREAAQRVEAGVGDSKYGGGGWGGGGGGWGGGGGGGGGGCRSFGCCQC